MFLVWAQLHGCATEAAARVDCESELYPIIGDAEAITSIIMSVSAIEAFINELSDVIEQELPYLDCQSIELANKLFSAEEQRLSLDDKVRIIVEHSGEPFDLSKKPLQDFRLLVELRNALVHYKTHNHISKRSWKPIKLLTKLRSKKILLNRPYIHQSSPAYTWFHDVSTVQAARWATDTSLAVITYLSSTLNTRVKHILIGFLTDIFESELEPKT
ncbi:TPA: hypothetical protein ACN30P_003225 [Vibrio parahaemolyticus]